MQKLKLFILILSFLPTQNIITHPILWISMPTYNLIHYMILDSYQKESLAIKDMIERLPFAQPQDKIIELTRIEHEIAALESFKGFYNPNATNADYLERYVTVSLRIGIILTAVGINVYQYVYNQPPYEWLLVACMINMATSLPTVMHQKTMLKQYYQAKKDTLTFNATNIEDVLTKKMNASLVAKINQEKCDIDRSSFRHLQEWHNLTPYRARENRPSTASARNKTMNALSQINIMRSRENKKELTKKTALLIKEFVGNDTIDETFNQINTLRTRDHKTRLPQEIMMLTQDFFNPKPWQPRQLTHEEESHIGTLPEEFYQRLPRNPAA